MFSNHVTLFIPIFSLADSSEGRTIEVPIVFEPERVGEITDTLTVSHPEAGQYVCTLVGYSTPPKPQGPFNLTPGTNATIQFRNVFNEAREFSYITDNSAFVVASTGQRIDSRQTVTISVKFSPTEGRAVNGQLLVSCVSLPDQPPWVFYLRGEM